MTSTPAEPDETTADPDGLPVPTSYTDAPPDGDGDQDDIGDGVAADEGDQ